jgi:hypothetical protein
MNNCLKLVEKTGAADVNWTHPLMGGNPFMMAMTWQMGMAKTLMEAHQKKVEAQQKKMIELMTGVWKV